MVGASGSKPDHPIILTPTNDEVRALNEAARERMRVAGDLGAVVRVAVERGASAALFPEKDPQNE